MDRELLTSADKESQNTNEVLTYYRTKAEVDFRPEVEIVAHTEIVSPWVISHGA